MADAFEIATWRYEQIAPLIDTGLTRQQRRRYVREKSREPVEWPQSERRRAAGKPPKFKPISRSTLYRWVKAYREKGFPGLLPKPRKDRGQPRTDREEVVNHALALLYEQPNRSLTQLQAYLRVEFPDKEISRSTLNRDLNAHPAYQGIKRQRRGGKGKTRTRYQADYPHQSWQLDGKGPFEVHLTDGSRVRVHALSVLDDYSRYVLATCIARSEDAAAAVRVFRVAASRYGLPERMQFDRGSAFESYIFRQGLAMLGAHRNWVKARTPENQGKIESYHDCLQRWFVDELREQEVVDLEHLEALLRATVDLVYNDHRHDELKKTPRKALNGAVAERRVSREDLLRPFWAKITKKSHAKTGEVVLPNGRFRVPSRYAGYRGGFRHDPVKPLAVLVTRSGDEIPLEPFETLHPFSNDDEEKRGTGQLQKLLDAWNGQTRPNAEPGFGLPEVFAEMEGLLGRVVPQDEREATAITRFYRRFGPLPAGPFRQAVERTGRELGSGRPLQAYLDHLSRLCRSDQRDDNENKEDA